MCVCVRNVFIILVCVSKKVLSVSKSRVRLPNQQVKWVTNLYTTLIFDCVCVFARGIDTEGRQFSGVFCL